jgi:uroporphyrinogen decarboxylase
MNGRERVIRYLEGRPVDRVPVAPVIDGYFAPRVSGRPSHECWRSPELMAQALCDCATTFGHDIVVVSDALGAGNTMLGCPVELDESSHVPLYTGHCVDAPADLDRLQPAPFLGSPGEATLLAVKARLGGDRFILGVVTTPFETAFIVRGHGFLADLVQDRGFAQETLAACLPLAEARARALVAAGVDGILFKDSVASSSMISPRHYAEFAFPWEKRVIEAVRDEAWTALHICRNAGPIVELMAQTGAHVLEVDAPCDVARALQATPAGVFFKGNVDAVAELQDGAPGDLARRVEELCALARRTRRLIVSTGDSTPFDTPLDRLHLFMSTAWRSGALEGPGEGCAS